MNAALETEFRRERGIHKCRETAVARCTDVPPLSEKQTEQMVTITAKPLIELVRNHLVNMNMAGEYMKQACFFSVPNFIDFRSKACKTARLIYNTRSPRRLWVF